MRKKERMHAAVITGPGHVEILAHDRPVPGADQVRIRLEGCGVCGSNLPPFEGRPWFQYPLPPGAPGHEGWGEIDAVGDHVTQWSMGDRVAFLSGNAFAEYDLAQETALIRLPAALEKRPFPGEALGCAWNVFRRARLEKGETVAIVGIGFLGALLVSLAAHAGARVLAMSRRPFALEIARNMGAEITVSLDHVQAAIACAKNFTCGQGFDCVIEAVGMQSALDTATELTRERGRLIIAGYHQDGPRQVNMQLWNWRGLDVVNAHERDLPVYIEGMRAMLDLILNGDLDPWPLFTHAYSLDRAQAAFCSLRDRPPDFLKALITL
ncbi:MAG: zinc-binding dehydrogenase [Verrucomicrobiota bacterium]